MGRNVNDPTVRRAIYDRDGGLCGFCHEPVEFERMHIDHITPWAVGGETEPANLRPAHPKCNIGNGRATVYAYLREHPETKLFAGRDEVGVSLRMPVSLREWLEQQADADHRNLNSLVVHYLDSIRKQQSQPPKPT